jgi:DNA ligase (NAD+)
MARQRKILKTRRSSSAKNILDSAEELRILKNQIRKARRAYFNTGEPIMSDEKYDALEKRLKNLDPDNALLKQVGAIASKSARKVTLPYNMPSLDKIKPNETLQNWLRAHPGPYNLSDKIDGVSAALVISGSNYKMFTRGNGSVGTDITHLVPHVKGIPAKPFTKYKAVRGELMFTRDRFISKYAEQFKNARNLASGVVNSKDISPAAKDLMFIVHQVLEPKVTLASAYNTLIKAGFNVAPSKTANKLDDDFLVEYLSARRAKSKVDIDGLVITSKSGSSVAFKSGYEVGTGTVKEIVWRATRDGFLKPTIILKSPVTLSGASISRLTAHNAKFLQTNGIGVGAVIELIRSGEVIPKVVRTIKSSKVSPFPTDIKWRWNASKVDIVLKYDTDSDESVTDRLVIFLIKLRVDKIKSSTVSKLVEHGIDTIEKMVSSNVDDFEEAGLGHASASHLESSIEQRLKEASIQALMAGSNLFDRGMGERKIGTIIADIPFKQQLVLYKTSKKELVDRISVVPGIGLSTAQSYVRVLPKFVKFLKDINWKPTKLVTPSVVKTGLGIAPIVVFTQFRDANLQLAIEKIGGTVGGTVTKNTTHVVTTNPKAKSAKLNKAKSLGIKIVTPEQIKLLLKSNYPR